VLIWDGTTIRALARRFPQLFENALFLAADYISWYVAAHAALTSRTAEERLAHVLSELAPSIGRKVAGGIELDVTNEELANSANITPYTTSRMISDWAEIWSDSEASWKDSSAFAPEILPSRRLIFESPNSFLLRCDLASGHSRPL